MLAVALARHPGIRVYDEGESYLRLIEAPPYEGRPEVFKIPRWTDFLPGPIRGEPRHDLPVAWTYGGEPLIHIVRQPADVIASMDRLKMGETTWLDRYGIPLFEWRLSSNPDLHARFEWCLQLPEDRRRWAIGAAYWRAKCEAALRAIDRGWPQLLVIYEHMVSDPDAGMSILLEYLGLTHDAGILSRLSAIQAPIGGTDPNRPIDRSSVGTGMRLPEEATSTIWEVAGTLYDDLVERADI